MQKIDVRTMDIAAALAAMETADDHPTIILKRDSAGPEEATWYILHDQFPKPQGAVEWSIDKKGTHIAVPLYSYRLNGEDPETVLRFGSQYSLMVAHEAGNKHMAISTMLIVFSQVFCRSDGQEGYEIYAGAAFREVDKVGSK